VSIKPVNGKGHPKALPMPDAPLRRKEIPMDGDFKDF
jgi:hypothetical protein